MDGKIEGGNEWAMCVCILDFGFSLIVEVRLLMFDAF